MSDRLPFRVLMGPAPCIECREHVYYAELEQETQRATWVSGAIVDENGEKHRCMKVCLNCGRPLPVTLFPEGRPRKDGTRWPMRFCFDCLEDRDPSDEQRRFVRALGRQEYRDRQRESA